MDGGKATFSSIPSRTEILTRQLRPILSSISLSSTQARLRNSLVYYWPVADSSTPMNPGAQVLVHS